MINSGVGWTAGCANSDATSTRGWFLGPFIGSDALRASHAVQIKWGRHADGDHRDEVAQADGMTSACILVSGRMLFRFGHNETVWLDKPGQFVVWRGVTHTWVADSEDDEETTTITVRWAEPPEGDE